MELPFTTPPYSSDIAGIGGDDAVNVRPEVAGPGAPSPRMLVHTPALRVFSVQNTISACRGLHETAGGRVFQVAGVNLWEIQSNGGRVLRGTVSSNSGPVGMADNGTKLVILDGVGGYVFDLVANSIAPIADTNFPDGAVHVAYAKSYFLTIQPGTGALRWSEINDPQSWPALNSTGAEASPDIAVALATLSSEAWVIGSRSIQVFYATGNPDQEWAPNQTVALDVGTEAPHSVASGRDAVFFVGSGSEGRNRVFRSTGYQVAPVSTPGIEGILAAAGDLSDAVGRYHSFGGHGYYVLTIAAAEKTLVYDADLGEWHERAWMNPQTGELRRWRGTHACFGHGNVLVGDSNGDAVYSLSNTVYTDEIPDGSGEWTIRRRRTSPHVISEGKRIQFPDLEIAGTWGNGTTTGQGVAPVLIVSHSDDGGRTWSASRHISAGALGAYTNRARGLLFGMSRDRMFRVEQTDPVPVCWYGMRSNARVLG